jgi:periplasmic divalent cation tolerance protein
VAYLSVQTTFPDEESARSFARELVERRLAACVQVLPVTSIYRWKGDISEEPEYLLMIKTLKKKVCGIKELMDSVHPYEVPELWMVPSPGGSKEYIDWVMASLDEKDQ